MKKKPELERLSVPYQIRLSPYQRELMDRAAASSGMSAADILRTGGIAEARRLLLAAKGDDDGR